MVGKARSFSDSAKESVYQKEFDDEVYSAATQQNSYNLGSVHFSDQSGIANISQAGSDQRKANLEGALFRGNIGFNLQTAVLDVGTETLNILEDESSNPLNVISVDKRVTLSAGLTGDLTTILGSQRPGQRLLLYGIQGNTITIKNTAAATPNTILTPDATDFTLTDTNVALLVYDITTTKWRVLSGGGGGGAIDPIILNEVDLGTIGFLTQTIDWSVSNFYRAILNGPISLSHINLPVSGKWEQLILEFQQDGTGGHLVTYLQGFGNGVVPLTNLTAGARTTVVFYAYNTGVSSVILAFETRSAGNTNFIHATKAAQQSPLTVGTAALFDTAISNSGITVTAGVFSGFRAGRTYECECALAFVSSGLAPEVGYQFFDIANVTLVGTKGHATSVASALLETSQGMAKFIFQPSADTDTLEVRFISNNDLVNNIMFGNPGAGDPTSYVMIKDIT